MVNFHNASILRGKSTSPYTLSTSQDALWAFRDFRVCGCPSYILAKRLQDGDSYGKWKQRCWQGAYIGNSTCHAGHIPLIYNPLTTHISPQYHVTFDEGFTSLHRQSSDIKEEILQKLYQKGQWSHSSEYASNEDLYYFDTLWLDPPLAPKPEGRGRKRLLTLTQAPQATTPEGVSHPAPGSIIASEGAPNLALGRLTVSEGAHTPFPIGNQERAPDTLTMSEGAFHSAPGTTLVPEGAHNMAPGITTDPEGAPTIPLNGPMHTEDATPYQSTVLHNMNPQFTAYYGTAAFQHYK